MLLNRQNDIAATAVATPTTIRDFLLPVRTACVHGIIDHANFDKVGGTEYRNYIENIADLPNSGKIFTGKWLDFSGDYGVDSTYKPRYKSYYDSTGTMVFDQLDWIHANAPAEFVLYWGIGFSGGNNYFMLYTYSSTTGTFTLYGLTANYNTNGVKNIVVGGVNKMTVNIKKVLGAAVGTTLDRYILLVPPTLSYAPVVYARFSDMCHYANQKNHYIRSMDYQISMTRDALINMTQGITSGINAEKEKKKQAANEMTKAVLGVYATEASGAISKMYYQGNVGERARVASAAGTKMASAGQAITDLKQINISITNKFRIEKPYASDLVWFDPRGACKMAFPDSQGTAERNKVHYQCYVSAESDDELEITIHSIFEEQEVLGEEDYIFMTGKIELLFESRA